MWRDLTGVIVSRVTSDPKGNSLPVFCVSFLLMYCSVFKCDPVSACTAWEWCGGWLPSIVLPVTSQPKSCPHIEGNRESRHTIWNLFIWNYFHANNSNKKKVKMWQWNPYCGGHSNSECYWGGQVSDYKRRIEVLQLVSKYGRVHFYSGIGYATVTIPLCEDAGMHPSTRRPWLWDIFVLHHILGKFISGMLLHLVQTRDSLQCVSRAPKTLVCLGTMWTLQSPKGPINQTFCV